MKKRTKRFIAVAGTTLAAMHFYNKFIEATATKNNLLSDDKGEYYPWKKGNVYYTKTGSGSPVLLIHDAEASSSSAEWLKLYRRLEKKHTVYCIDLLGCGRSDKPSLEYTNYLYVQLITSFVKDVIQEKTTVIASNMSASFVIMANHLDATLFEKIVLINPVSLEQLNETPDKKSKLRKRVIELPVIGTFIYNRLNTASKVDEKFRTRYVAKPQLISSNLEALYYESAHKNSSNGKYLYSSSLGNYLNNSISHALKDLTTPTLIIGSSELKNNTHVLDDYYKVNSKIDIVRITNGSLYPHMEVPDKINSIIEDYLL